MIDLRECKLYGDEKFVVPDKPVNVCESTCYSDDKVHITVDWDDIMNVPNNLATTEYVTEALAAVSTTWDGGEVNNPTKFKNNVLLENQLYIKTPTNGGYRGVYTYDENGRAQMLIARKLGENGNDLSVAYIDGIYSRWRPDNEDNKFIINIQGDEGGYYTALECFYNPNYNHADTTVCGDMFFRNNISVSDYFIMHRKDKNSDGEYEQNAGEPIWCYLKDWGFWFSEDLIIDTNKSIYVGDGGIVNGKTQALLFDTYGLNHYLPEYFNNDVYVKGYEVITTDTIGNYIQNGGGGTGSGDWNGGTVMLSSTFESDVTFNWRTTFNFAASSIQNDTHIDVHNKNDGSSTRGLMIGQWGINHYLPEWFYEPIYVNGYEVITTETINNYIQNGGNTGGGENTGSWNGGTVNGVTTFNNQVTFNANPYFNCQYVYMNNVSEVQIGSYDDYQAGVMWGIKMGRLYSNNMSCEYLHISQRDALDIIDQNNTTKAKFAIERTDIYTPLYVNNAEVITTANIGNYVSGGTGGEGTGGGESSGASVDEVIDTLLWRQNTWYNTQYFNNNPRCEGYENIHAGNINNYVSGGGSSLNIWKGTQTQFEEAQIDPSQYDFIFIIAE